MVDRARLEKAVEHVKAGNREAFREIVSATAVVLRAYISFFLDDPVLVDDLVQEVYVDTYQDIGKYALGTDFMAWMKTKGRFAALAARRRLARKRDAHRRYTTELSRFLSNHAEKHEESHPLEDKLSALMKCLEGLSEKISDLVRMKYFQERSLNDIAEACGMTRVAVGTALHRARAALAKCVAEGIGGG